LLIHNQTLTKRTSNKERQKGKSSGRKMQLGKEEFKGEEPEKLSSTVAMKGGERE